MIFSCVLQHKWYKREESAHTTWTEEIKIRARNVPFRKWLMNIISYFQIIYLDSTCEWNEITRNPIIHSTKSNWISFKLQKGESVLWCPHIFHFIYFTFSGRMARMKKKEININFPIFFNSKALRLLIHCLRLKHFKYRSLGKPHLIATANGFNLIYLGT